MSWNSIGPHLLKKECVHKKARASSTWLSSISFYLDYLKVDDVQLVRRKCGSDPEDGWADPPSEARDGQTTAGTSGYDNAHAGAWHPSRRSHTRAEARLRGPQLEKRSSCVFTCTRLGAWNASEHIGCASLSSAGCRSTIVGGGGFSLCERGQNTHTGSLADYSRLR